MIMDVRGSEGRKGWRWLEGETESEKWRTQSMGALIRQTVWRGRGRVSLGFQGTPQVESLLCHLRDARLWASC